MCLWRVSNILFTNISTHSRLFRFSFFFFFLLVFQVLLSFIFAILESPSYSVIISFFVSFFIWIMYIFSFLQFSIFSFFSFFTYSLFLLRISFFLSLRIYTLSLNFAYILFPLNIVCYFSLDLSIFFSFASHIHSSKLSFFNFIFFYFCILFFFSLMFYYTLSFVSFSIWPILSFSFNFGCYFSFFCFLVYSTFCNIPCLFSPSIFFLLIWHIRIIFLSFCIAHSSCFDILCVLFLSSKRFAIDFLNPTFHSFLLFIFVLTFTKHNIV